MSTRKKYTPEYRAEAARLVIDTDRPIAHVARELGVGEQLLSRCVQHERDKAAPPVALVVACRRRSEQSSRL